MLRIAGNSKVELSLVSMDSFERKVATDQDLADLLTDYRDVLKCKDFWSPYNFSTGEPARSYGELSMREANRQILGNSKNSWAANQPKPTIAEVIPHREVVWLPMENFYDYETKQLYDPIQSACATVDISNLESCEDLDGVNID